MMPPLIAQMLLCLLAAAAVGFLVCWSLRRGQVAELTAETERLRAIVPTGVLPSALSTRLELLARLMEEVKLRPATESVELHRLLEAQQALQGTLTELARRLPPVPPALDLTPIVQKLADLSTMERRMEALADRLDDLARALDGLRTHPLHSRPAAPPAPRSPPPRKDERDDLILIHGVGPVLQRLLHRMGIYRFEQVMNWDADDVAAVTARLPSFKGRIEREGWVESARREYEKKYRRARSDATTPAHSH